MQDLAIEILSAGAAASLGVIFTNPLEVSKVRLQMTNELAARGLLTKDHQYYRGIWHCLSSTYGQEGIRGLQRGLNVAVARDFGKCSFRIGMYDPVERKLKRMFLDNTKSTNGSNWSSMSMIIKFTSAIFCGGVSAILLNPLDIAKARVQASMSKLSTSHYDIPKNASILSVLRQVCLVEKEVNVNGVITKQSSYNLGNLWYGTRVNVARSIIFTVCVLPTNSTLKQIFDEKSSKGAFRSALETIGLNSFANDPINFKLAYGAFQEFTAPLIASSIGVTVMNPVDVVRTRLYNQPKDSHGKPKLYNSALDCGMKIVKSEGTLALWKGTFSHFLRTGPQTILTFIFMGQIRKYMLPEHHGK